MKKSVLMLTVAVVIFLLAGCGKKAGGAVEDHEVNEENTAVVSDAEPIDEDGTTEEITEAAKQPAEAEQAEVFNNGGEFVKVGERVYYRKFLFSWQPAAMWGKFRAGASEDTVVELMCYDESSGETSKAGEYIGGSPYETYCGLCYSDGKFYTTTMDGDGVESVVSMDPADGRTDTLAAGKIVTVDSAAKQFAVYDRKGGEIHLFCGDKELAAVSEPGENAGTGFCLKDGILVYNTWSDEDAAGEGYEGNFGNYLHAFDLTEQKDYCLGRLPEPEMDDWYDMQVDRISIRDGKAYVGVGFYAGTGHFYNEGYVCAADVHTPGSITKENYVNQEGIEWQGSAMFLDSVLPDFYYADYPEYSVFLNGRNICVNLPDEKGGFSETVYGDMPEDAILETGSECEVMEYVDGAVYMVVNELVYNEEESIGWREAYSLVATRYLRADQKAGECRDIDERTEYDAGEAGAGTESILVHNPSTDAYNSGILAAVSEALPVTLTETLKEKNGIIDEEEWSRENGLNDLRYDNGEYDCILNNHYDMESGTGYELELTDPYSGKTRRILDLSEFYDLCGHGMAVEYGGEVYGRYAEFGGCYSENGIAYITMFHMTYAESMPYHAYIIAVDIESGELLWKSEALTNNAFRFVVLEDVIICGYGFTAEPDYIYQIDKKTGSTKDKRKVDTAPDYLFYRDGKLYVRCYDTNYVFEVTRS